MSDHTTQPKVALVTGASRGLGAALAIALAAQGWQVVAVARTTGGLEETDDRFRKAHPDSAGAITLAPMDITNDDAMRHLCLSIHQRWGALDLWMHPAVHAAPLSPAGFVDGKDWDKSVTINLRAMGVLIPMITPLLMASASRGTAMMFDDPRGGLANFGAYGATKAGQIALVRSWQAETAKTGPKVRIETPAPMPTATRARFFPGEDRSPLTHPDAEAARLVALL